MQVIEFTLMPLYSPTLNLGSFLSPEDVKYFRNALWTTTKVMMLRGAECNEECIPKGGVCVPYQDTGGSYRYTCKGAAPDSASYIFQFYLWGIRDTVHVSWTPSLASLTSSQPSFKFDVIEEGDIEVTVDLKANPVDPYNILDQDNRPRIAGAVCPFSSWNAKEVPLSPRPSSLLAICATRFFATRTSFVALPITSLWGEH